MISKFNEHFIQIEYQKLPTLVGVYFRAHFDLYVIIYSSSEFMFLVAYEKSSTNNVKRWRQYPTMKCWMNWQ